MSEDTKATLGAIGFFVGLTILAILFSGSLSPSRTEDPDAFYESHGYTCETDCSGHDAGYEWARDNNICEPGYDEGNSDSFNEGVSAYAYENCESESGGYTTQ